MFAEQQFTGPLLQTEPIWHLPVQPLLEVVPVVNVVGRRVIVVGPSQAPYIVGDPAVSLTYKPRKQTFS